MSSNHEHNQLMLEYMNFVESVKEIDGKLHIVTLEKTEIITEFTSSGWIVSR